MKTAATATLACLLLCAAHSGAQTPASEKPLATRAEYRECVEKSDALVARQEAMRTRKANHDADAKQLQDDMALQVAAGEKLNTKKSGAVEAYNAKNSELIARRDELNRNVAQFEKDVAEHNRNGTEHNQRCSGMRVAREDREAVMKERADRAGKK